MKREILDEAKRRGADPEMLAELERASPAKVKKWAQVNGLPSRMHPGRGHTAEDVEQPVEARPSGGDGHGNRARDESSGSEKEPEMFSALQEILDVVKGGRAGPQGRPAGGAGAGAGRRGGRAARQPAPAAPRPSPAEEVPEWSTPELQQQIATGRRIAGEHRDEKNLLGGAPGRLDRAFGGTNETSRVTLSNGVVGYHKPFSALNDEIAEDFGHDSAQQPMHEVAAWRVAERMGEPWDRIVPPCVLREVDGEMGSFAMERPGVPNTPVDQSQEWRDAAFFDAFIGQQDRHRLNYLGAGDRLVLIDHGYAFGREGDYVNFSDFVSRRTKESVDDPHRGRLTGKEIDVLDRFFNDETRFGLKGLIQPDRLAAVEHRARRMRETGHIFAGL